MNQDTSFELSCPLPFQKYQNVVLAHGGGGTLMHHLIESVFFKGFNSSATNQHDASVIQLNNDRIAMTTDSYVVQPLFFPGGDIGSLAVHGTVNDLAMGGARPLALSAGFILEEGLPIETLQRIVDSMQKAAQECGVQIITGDTKVVDKGKGDGCFINTAGVGVIEHEREINPQKVQPGDVVLINGDLGRHGIAIMSVREGLEFEAQIESDSAPLADLVMTLLNEGIDIHCMRDLTRGGLASTLNEIAQAAKVNITIYEKDIPVNPNVQGACEILGFDPLYVANEGRFALFVSQDDANKALEIMKEHTMGKDSSIIGSISKSKSPLVTMKSQLGASRIIDMLSGEQLPRIC